MPTRILRDGILTSERVARLDWEAEVFYRRLMSVVDDHGLYPAMPALLRAALYPLQLDSVRNSTVERCLLDCAAARLVRLYEVNGKQYLHLLDFGQRVRGEPKYPLPPPDGSPPQFTVVDGNPPQSAAKCGSPPQSAAKCGLVGVGVGDEGVVGVGDEVGNTPRGGAREGEPILAPGQLAPKPESRRFRPPSLDEWQRYGQTLTPPWPIVEADNAYDHYVANGWKVGKNPVKDWQACVRTCHRNWQTKHAMPDSRRRPAATSNHAEGF